MVGSNNKIPTLEQCVIDYIKYSNDKMNVSVY